MAIKYILHHYVSNHILIIVCQKILLFTALSEAEELREVGQWGPVPSTFRVKSTHFYPEFPVKKEPQAPVLQHIINLGLVSRWKDQIYRLEGSSRNVRGLDGQMTK